MVASVHPIGVHGAEILDLEFDEGFGQIGRVAQIVGEFVCFVVVRKRKKVISLLFRCSETSSRGDEEGREGERGGGGKLGTYQPEIQMSGLGYS